MKFGATWKFIYYYRVIRCSVFHLLKRFIFLSSRKKEKRTILDLRTVSIFACVLPKNRNRSFYYYLPSRFSTTGFFFFFSPNGPFVCITIECIRIHTCTKCFRKITFPLMSTWFSLFRTTVRRRVIQLQLPPRVVISSVHPPLHLCRLEPLKTPQLLQLQTMRAYARWQ